LGLTRKGVGSVAFMFTQQKLKGLKAVATDRRQEHRDLGGPNLYVVVQPKSGEISFVIRRRCMGSNVGLR
jgi:hypothetical protein